jgi:hypothetical protein
MQGGDEFKPVPFVEFALSGAAMWAVALVVWMLVDWWLG